MTIKCTDFDKYLMFLFHEITHVFEFNHRSQKSQNFKNRKKSRNKIFVHKI